MAALFMPAIKRQQQKYARALLAAGAVSEETAVMPKDAGIVVTQAFRNMIWRGKVVRMKDGSCYLTNLQNERRERNG